MSQPTHFLLTLFSGELADAAGVLARQPAAGDDHGRGRGGPPLLLGPAARRRRRRRSLLPHHLRAVQGHRAQEQQPGRQLNSINFGNLRTLFDA